MRSTPPSQSWTPLVALLCLLVDTGRGIAELLVSSFMSDAHLNKNQLPGLQAASRSAI